MRRPLPIFLLIVLALLMAGSLAGGAVNAAADLPTTSGNGFGPNNRTPVTAERGEQIARDHLLANASLYGVSRDDLTGLRVITNYADSMTGARYVKFVQTHQGIAVHNAVVNVTILPSGTVLYVGNRAVPALQKAANTAVPTLSQSDAIAAAAGVLALRYSPSTVTQQDSLGGAEREIRYSGGDLSLEFIPVKLAYQPVADGSMRLAWDLNIYQRDAQHWWDVRVDALTGAMLDKGDWVVSENWDALLNDPGQIPTGAVPGAANANTSFADEIVFRYAAAPSLVGSYRVYQIPVESPNHTTPLPPADGRTLVANPDNATASPFGWHDTNGAAGAEFTTTQGNNVFAYTDVDANNTPDAGSSPDGGAGLLFDFPLDLTLAPSGYRPAAVTNLFYWNNIIHDVSFLYGFNSAAGNFQENTYGGGGLGSDSVNAEAQDGSGTNNANFSTPVDGQNPRMQMYIWTAPTPDRDGDIDNGIILHEYGHGVSNRLTGTGPGCLGNAEQMGEGWSDWQTVMYTMRPGDTATTNRGVGTYALNQPTNGQGIRPAPYNTNFAVNNYTYSNLPSMAVPHGVGFVWNTMLWEMNWELINFHGFNPNIYDFTAINDGNILAYKLVQDGMAIQPCSPGFVDGRNAILAADVALTGGANECRIWAAFARRGLGLSASQGSASSTTDGTAAFDLPPQCTGGPTFTPTATRTPTATLPGGAQVVTYCSTFQPLAIPDSPGGFVTGTLTIPASATILDANVQISATHTFIGDLIFRLSNGTTSTVVVDRPGRTTSGFGCGGDNILGSFVDDEGAAGNWEGSCSAGSPAYPAGSRMIGGDPANPALMTVYDGGNTSGTWSLGVSDNAGGDTGTLNRFCMEFIVPGGGGTATPTATPTNTTVPSTNTPTATPTNTPVVPTNTPTATASPTPGGGGSRFCSTAPITIPDANPTGATGTINVGVGGTISDLNVVVTGTHSWVGDIVLNLSNGTTNVTFYDQPGVPASTFGCSGDNLPGVIADDEGVNGSFENSCQNATPAFIPGGSYTNNAPLSAFDGAATNDTWTLTASDLAAGDTGTITGWCVEFGTGPGPTATVTPSATTPPQDPDINVTPNAFEETHSSPPQTTNDTMNIQNVGSGTLTWTITEDDTATDWIPAPLVPGPNSVETTADGAAPVPATNPAPVGKPGYVPGMNGGVLYDNGPLVNVPGGGAGGADASRLQDASLLLSTYGFGHALSSGFRVADDFTVPAGQTWTISTVTFFAYQTGSSTTSTINHVNVRIWDGIPGAGGSNVVFGDTTTNRLASSTWSNAYRDLESAPGDATRPVMANTVTINTALPAGTYWIDWQTGGTLGSGPWAPPISINGQAVTGNALQFDPTASTWNAAIDAGAAAQQGFPFVVEGTGGGGGACSAPTDIPWLTVSPLNGSTPGGGSTPVTLTYNSASLATGTYTGTLCIASNDPDEALVTVPITLNVGPPTAIDLSSFTSPMSGINPADLAAAGLLLLAGAVLVLRRK